jgi:hypothetical protein
MRCCSCCFAMEAAGDWSGAKRSESDCGGSPGHQRHVTNKRHSDLAEVTCGDSSRNKLSSAHANSKFNSLNAAIRDTACAALILPGYRCIESMKSRSIRRSFEPALAEKRFWDARSKK